MKQLLLGATPLGAAGRGGGMGLGVGGAAAGLTPASAANSQSQFFYDAESGWCAEAWCLWMPFLRSSLAMESG
jgi:hypothetical protein